MKKLGMDMIGIPEIALICFLHFCFWIFIFCYKWKLMKNLDMNVLGVPEIAIICFCILL